jgi:soluble lytic murein transglycosylase
VGGGTIRTSGRFTDRLHIGPLVRDANEPAIHIKPPRRRALVWLLASAMAVAGTANALSAERHKSTSSHGKKAGDADHAKGERHKHDAKHKKGEDGHGKAEAEHHKHVVTQPADEEAVPLPPDLVALKQANDLIHHGKGRDATALAASFSDPVAAKLVEWVRLRHSDSDAGFDRYLAFIRANPDWPSMALMRRRAEAKLWQERRDGATVRRFVGDEPTSALGKLALARVEMSEGNRAAAESRVRAVWQSESLTAETEAAILAAFPDLLTRADHVARMDRRIGAKEFGAAMRAAKHVDDEHVAIVNACSSGGSKSAKGSGSKSAKGGSKSAKDGSKSAKAGTHIEPKGGTHIEPKGGMHVDDVVADAHEDLGRSLCRLQALLRNDSPGSNVRGKIVTPKSDYATAVKLTLAASPDDLLRQDTDEWWRARRMLARKLLDIGDAANAYEVVRTAAPPANPYYRAEFHHMAGWIALRFLHDPARALEHFAHADEGITDPVPVSRAAYWRGRAAEAAGQLDEMRRQYEAAAQYPVAYYGQLARARLGLDDVVEVRSPPPPADATTNEVLRAAEMLYRTGKGDLAMSFVTDLAEGVSDPAVIAGAGKLTKRYNDAQAMLLVGKAALARGMPMDVYAYPDIGVPNFTPVGPQVERCIVYSIVRTESGFDQHDASAAKAVGLMQVTPGAGQDTAKRFGVSYDWSRLVSDPVYNTQMGAAEIAGLLKDYRGSYILTFAGYNAGRGRVEQWMALHGDPRDPKVDAVDWVERIPFSETRNYVQRVMENLQVYRARFGAATATVEPNLHRSADLSARPPR